MNEVFVTLLKTGAIGAVLAWALWQNQKLVAEIISVIKENSRVLSALTSEIREMRRMQ